MRYYILPLLLIVTLAGFGQDSLLLRDAGHILPTDFNPQSPVVDSNADLIVLADAGHAEIVPLHGWGIRYSHYRRILIRNTKGLEVAKVELSFDREENGPGRLAGLQASTYNLENGKVIPTPLDSPDVFLEDEGNGKVVERFSFPNAKAGSIVEYSYSIYSAAIFQLHPWDFQGDYPRLKSEYTISFPAVFNYVLNIQGSLPTIRSVDSVKKKIAVGSYFITTLFYNIRWTAKDVPAVHTEPFVATMDKYIAGLRFQLSEYTDLSTRKRVKEMNDWKGFNQRLYEYKAYGGVMTTSTHFLRKELRSIVEDSVKDMDKARALFVYVRDHFTTKGHELLSEDDRSLKDIFKAGKGSEEEINLVLTAMLRDEGLAADAVILSTRDNGVINPYYPLTENFNYTVVRLRIGGKAYFLDATNPRIGFGKLPLQCYNGYARIVSEQPDSVFLRADSVEESTFTSAFLSENDAGGMLTGNYTATKGYYASLDIRDYVADKGLDHYFDDIKKSFPFAVNLSDKHIDSLKVYDQPVVVRYSVSFPTGGEDRIYINPMLSEAVKDNPFESATRRYLVEMPYVVNDLYVFRMGIPKGYVVEEMPKSVKVKLNDDDGTYEYGIMATDDAIQVRSKLVLRRADFQPEDYQSLRDFYAFIVKKQAEVIVFKKKS